MATRKFVYTPEDINAEFADLWKALRRNRSADVSSVDVGADMAPDTTRHNTIQFNDNGDVWYVDREGNSVVLSGGGVGGDTIYTGDDSLDGNREVDLDANSLLFSEQSTPLLFLDPANYQATLAASDLSNGTTSLILAGDALGSDVSFDLAASLAGIRVGINGSSTLDILSFEGNQFIFHTDGSGFRIVDDATSDDWFYINSSTGNGSIVITAPNTADNGYSQIRMNNSDDTTANITLSMADTAGSESAKMTLNDGLITVEYVPINYAADYSASYTDRSLVDREFVLNNAGLGNIYSTDGVLAGNREVVFGGFNLEFRDTLGSILTMAQGDSDLRAYNDTSLGNSSIIEFHASNTEANTTWAVNFDGGATSAEISMTADVTNSRIIHTADTHTINATSALQVDAGGFTNLNITADSSNMRAYNNTDDGNTGRVRVDADSTEATASIFADFNDGVQLAQIDMSADASEALINYTANLHTVTGSVRLLDLAGNGDGVVAVDNDGDLSFIATPGGVNYDVYTVALVQTSTNDPVATVMENTIGAIVWARTGVGTYTGTLTGAFTVNKTFIVNPVQTLVSGFDIAVFLQRADADTISISAFASGAPSDDILGLVGLFTYFEIRVYP